MNATAATDPLPSPARPVHPRAFFATMPPPAASAASVLPAPFRAENGLCASAPEGIREKKKRETEPTVAADETAARKTEKELGDKITFFAFIIPEFAAAFKMKISDAYQFLKKHGGLDFLNRHWWALHTDSQSRTLEDLFDACKRNGGPR